MRATTLPLLYHNYHFPDRLLVQVGVTPEQALTLPDEAHFPPCPNRTCPLYEEEGSGALPIKSDSSASCTVWPIVHSTAPNRDARHNLVGDERSAGADFMGKARAPARSVSKEYTTVIAVTTANCAG